ncbi:polysaccharide pyruvyl transferase family protein [Serratia sp. J2]|uniref:polysaccharide pyruvyl transferase family protein n=1 Tax=Serratia sp. J2 TaxID=3386551 RepID=UPI00391744EF
MKVLIINQHTNNYGDDAAGYALTSSLIEKGYDVDVTYIWNENGTKIPIESELITHHESYNLSRKNLLREIANYYTGKEGYFKKITELAEKSDVVLVSPGGANIGIYKDWAYLVNVIFARKKNKNLIFHLNTISKSNSKIFNVLAKYVLAKCILFVREKASFELLRSMGIHSTLGVDSAFLLKKNVRSADVNGKVLTFVPTELSNWHVDFKNVNDGDILKNGIIPALARFAAENGFRIKILPHLYSSESEHDFLEKIRRSLTECNSSIDITIDNSVDSFFKYDQSIADSNLVVSMRYHGVVLSVKNEIPVISLAYENKMKECCRYSGILSQNIDLLNFESGELDTLLNNTIKINNNIYGTREFLEKMSSVVLNHIELYNR